MEKSRPIKNVSNGVQECLLGSYTAAPEAIMAANRCSTRSAILVAILFAQLLVFLMFSPLLNWDSDNQSTTSIFANRKFAFAESNKKYSVSNLNFSQTTKMDSLKPISHHHRLSTDRSDIYKKLPTRNPNSSPITVTTTTQQPDPSGPDPKCGYLARMPPAGRLGSQMFAYATFYGIVKRQEKSVNKTAFIRIWEHPHYLKPIFEKLTLEHRAVSKKWFGSRNFILMPEFGGCCRHESSLAENLRCDGKNIYVDGYRLSYKYFEPYLREIRDEFVFKKSIQQKSYRLFYDTLSELGVDPGTCTTVCAHLRRGDFTKPRKISYGHMAAKATYLQKAVQFFENKTFAEKNLMSKNETRCLTFLLFGNDYEWNLNVSKQMKLQKPKQTYFGVVNFNKSSPAVDMHTFSLCDHAIISTGTFGWWSAFFNSGTVTYQKEYARPDSMHYMEYEPKDYFLPDWIPL